jgi:hypothetical protein
LEVLAALFVVVLVEEFAVLLVDVPLLSVITGPKVLSWPDPQLEALGSRCSSRSES